MASNTLQPIFGLPDKVNGRNRCSGGSFVASSCLPDYDLCSSLSRMKQLCDAGLLHRAVDVLYGFDMQGCPCSVEVYGYLLHACRRKTVLREAKRVHAHLVRSGFDSHSELGESVVITLVSCGALDDALQVFHKLGKRTVYSWTAIIAGYTKAGKCGEALSTYQQMQEEEGIQPNRHTFLGLLKACGNLGDLEQALRMHADVIRHRCDTDLYVGTSLVDMYAKCGSIGDAQLVFDGLCHRSVVSWNAMLAGYAQHGEGERVFQLYCRMQEAGVSPDDRTCLALLQACVILAESEGSTSVDGESVKVGSLQRGKAVHAESARRGYASDKFVSSSLVSMYSRCGSISDAHLVFEGQSQRDVVSWTAMIAGYAHQDQGEKALGLYARMQAESFKPEESTYLCVLRACSTTGSLHTCRQVHRSILSCVFTSLSLANSLIHTYSKCGSMVDAQAVFDSLPQPDVVSWNALIAGYASQGLPEMCVHSFHQMRRQGTSPDGITFLAILSACSHGGMVDAGLEFFASMSEDHHIPPALEHYACVIDLLGRAGLLTQALHLLLRLPIQPDGAMWLSLLGACRKHKNVALGRQAFDCAVRLQPQHASAYVLMSNIYAQAGMWDCAIQVDQLRKQATAWKERGQSWIELEKKVHTFVAGDGPHQQSAALLRTIEVLWANMRRETHVSESSHASLPFTNGAHVHLEPLLIRNSSYFSRLEI